MIKELILIQIRSLIADKELLVQNAVRENQMGGWLRDYNKECDEIDRRIADAIKKLQEEYENQT